MRTERRINRAEIMPQVSGEQQRLAIQAALNLYEQKPPIPFTWEVSHRVRGSILQGLWRTC